ncbi:hypothetical protein [Winogradskyella wichelsiae]|uniref:hypothetical protein n=1 Tax=Winogradskyella wichelsiae TaxID=2697007 RepID=UPI0015CA11D2|nr:hypothetical protein [Winogradskyella wichelsiae]
MKKPFKILILLLITSVLSHAQSHRILKESIAVDKNTSIVLNFENIYVALEESTDGKIHFDYVMEFEGHSKKDIQERLKDVTAEVSNFENHITLTAKSKSQMSFESYEFKKEYGITYNDDFLSEKKDSIIRKSKDSLLKIIRYNNRVARTNNGLKYINERFKKIDKDGGLTNFRKGTMDVMRSVFVIKIPPYVKLNINGKNSGIHFRNNTQNEISLKLKSGTLKTKVLINTFNNIRIDDANFEADAISGGEYKFKNVKDGKIGSVQNTKITSEFSKLEIGEIQKHVTITDFNSEYYFYNWAKDFKRFNLYSEYSKIHFFYPKLDYSFKVIGNNTKNFIDKYTIEMQPTKKGEKFNMMERKSQGNGEFSGEIFFDIIHGIIYSYDDSFKKTDN